MKKHFLVLTGALFSLMSLAQVGINPNGSAPHSSAGLDIDFNNLGFLPPRLSTAERDLIVSPANGLIIYNTDCDVLNYNSGTPSSPNWSSLTSSNSLPVSVNILAQPASAVCDGSSVTYIAIFLNAGSSPQFQWNKNGNPISGATASTYTELSPENGDIISCTVTSGAACAIGSPAISNEITQLVNPTMPVSIGIAAEPSGSVCAGISVVLTATPVNGGSNPGYQWRKNGIDLYGETSSSYTSSILEDGDIITCVVNSNATCATGSPAISNIVTMDVYSPPLATFSASPAIPVIGQTVTFIPDAPGLSYQWTFASGTPSTSAVENPTVNWDEVGSYEVSLEVVLTGCDPVSSSHSIDIVPLQSCKDLLADTPGLPDGIYSIAPDGVPMDCYCDMTTDGGGWTLVGKNAYQSRANATSDDANGWPLSSYSIGDDDVSTGKLSDAKINSIASGKEVRLVAPATTKYIQFDYSGTYTYTWNGIGISNLTSTFFATWSNTVEQGTDGWFLRGQPYDGEVVGMGAGDGYCGGSSTNNGPGTQTNINTCDGTNQTWYRFLWFVR